MLSFPLIMELVAVIAGLIYILLAAKNDIRCWYFGILSTVIWVWVTVEVYSLYADGLLNFFYVIMGFVGWYQWKKGGSDGSELPVSQIPVHKLLLILLAGLVFSFAGGRFLAQYTPAMATYWDASTTVFSIIATFMLIQRKIENWPLWIVTNTAYIGLYLTRGAYGFAALFVIYTVLAFYGWQSWKRELRSQV